jgi:hypothetical protein
MFGEPVISNTTRGLFVEAMLSVALEEDGWDWVAEDWSSWDFEHCKTWVTVEVKQSAARQPWSEQFTHDPTPRFDIAKRTGYWYHLEGDPTVLWHAERCRPADIYIFAWHGGLADSDQRDPAEWEFYVCDEGELPEQKTIGLAALQKKITPVRVADLSRALSAVAGAIDIPKQRRK